MSGSARSTETLAAREVPLGGPRAMMVRRTLPHRDRRTVGAWCFVDDYGPDDIAGTAGMQVPPHPHTGLQTVSWLLSGEVLHRDSLGSEQLIRPGQLNLMTAGLGIAHSEESTPDGPTVLRGVQLWVALPEAERDRAPAFDHHADLPVVEEGATSVTVLMGSLAGVTSPARCHTPIVGAEVALGPGGGYRLPVEPGFEHAVLALGEGARVAGEPLDTGSLRYLPDGATGIDLGSDGPPVRLLLLGGEPLDEDLLMWWNFVGRSHEDMVAARADWEAARLGEATRFGEVVGYDGPPLPAPELPTTRLRARPRVRR